MAINQTDLIIEGASIMLVTNVVTQVEQNKKLAKGTPAQNAAKKQWREEMKENPPPAPPKPRNWEKKVD